MGGEGDLLVRRRARANVHDLNRIDELVEGSKLLQPVSFGEPLGVGRGWGEHPDKIDIAATDARDIAPVQIGGKPGADDPAAHLWPLSHGMLPSRVIQDLAVLAEL